MEKLLRSLSITLMFMLAALCTYAQTGANIDWDCLGSTGILLESTSSANSISHTFTSSGGCQVGGFTVTTNGTPGSNGTLRVFLGHANTSEAEYLRLDKTQTTSTFTSAKISSTSGATFTLTKIAVSPSSATPANAQSITLHAMRGNTEVGFVTTTAVTAFGFQTLSGAQLSAFTDIDNIIFTPNGTSPAGVGIDIFQTASVGYTSPGTVEYFEGATVNAKTFTNAATGLAFNITGGLFVENTLRFGVDNHNPPTSTTAGSDFYLDNFGATATGQTEVIKSANGTLFTAKSLYAYPSSIAAGDHPTNDGSLTFIGKKGGVQQFSVNNSGFKTAVSLGTDLNGFSLVNFSEGTDVSNTLIDELDVVLNAPYRYVAIDNFAFTATPNIVNNTATSITTSGAVLNASVNPSGSAASAISFDYGTSPTLATSTNIAATPSTLGSATTGSAVSATISGLAAGTTYYYRAKATNSNGTNINSTINSFTTTAAALATVTTTAVTTFAANTATLAGNVSADGGASVTEKGIVYNIGGTPTITDTKIANGSGTGAISVNATGLAPGTTYHVRAYATNSAGTAYGTDQSFTTQTVASTCPQVTTADFTSADDVPPFNKTINGQSFTFAGTAHNFMSIGTDVGGFSGLYPYTYVNNETQFTITAPSGHSFDFNSFQYVSDRATVPLTVTLTFANNTTDTKIYNLTSNSIVKTFTGFTTAANDIKSITFHSTELLYYNGFCIDDVKLIPVAATTLSSLNSVNTLTTNAATVNYTATFAAAVTGLTASNFTLSGAGATGASVGTPTTTNNITWNIPVNTSANGTLLLTFANATGLSPSVSNINTAGNNSYTIDKTLPTLIITRSDGNPIHDNVLDFQVVFSKAVTGVDATDFVLINTGGVTNGAISASMINAITYNITVVGVAGTGTARLDLKGSGTGITDAAGNIPTAYTGGQIYNIDQTAPTVTIASSSALIKLGETATITFTFSEDPGASFTNASIQSTDATPGTVTGSGLTRTVTFVPTAGANNGTATISVQAGAYTDAAGNGGGAATLTIHFDTAPPNAPFALALAAGNDNGISNTDQITSITTPSITGKAEANAIIKLYDGITVLGTTTADVSGNWTIISSTLSTGTHGITATATDAAGNLSTPSQPLNVTIGTPPVATTDSYSTTTSQVLTVNALTGILKNDTDADGNLLTAILVSGPAHGTLTLNADGSFTFTPTVNYNGGDSFTYKVSDGAFVSSTVSVSITVALPIITVGPSTLPGATVGIAYNQTITATGGTSYTYAVSTGALPTGLTLNGTNGAITGTPTAAGTFNFTVTATDASTAFASQAYTVVVTPPTTLITPATLPGGGVGIAYNQNIVASGGIAPYTYSVTAGAVPNGLTLSTSGALTGTPTTGGIFNFTATATGSSTGSGAPHTGSRAYSLVIGTATQTITFADVSATYGDAPVTLTGTASSGLAVTYASSDPTVATVSGNTVTILKAGSTIITASQTGNGNYSAAADVPKTLTVNAKAITVTATAQSKTYGDVDPALVYTITTGALVTGDAFTGSLTRDAGENAGTYVIKKGSLALSNNYTLTYTGANLTIGARAITVTANVQSKTYGAVDPVLTYQITSGSLAFADTFTGALTRDAGENAGTYAIKQGTLALSSNYALTYASANLSITPRTLTVTATGNNKTYDGNTTATVALSDNRVAGDLFTESYAGASFNTPGVGTSKPVNVTGIAISGGASANYTLGNVTASTTADITAIAIAVTANAQTKTYGAADPALTYTYTGTLAGSDAFTGALSRAPGEAVNTYAINQNTLVLSSNYSLTYNGANLAIIPAALTITATGPAKPFGTALTTGASTTNFTATATQNGETVNSVILTPNAAGLSATTPSGANYTVIPSAATGTNGFTTSNYNITYVPFTGTVGTTGQTIAFGPLTSAIYGQSPVTLTATASSGLAVIYTSSNPSVATVSGNTLTIVGAGSTTITAKQAGNGNYTAAADVPQSLTVNAKAITVTADAKTKTYGDTDPALTYKITTGTLVGTDAFAGALTRDAGENAGSYAITQGTLALSSNYTLTYTSGNLIINTKAITVTADAKSKTYGDTDPALTYKITSGGALVTGDTFTGTLTRDAGENVGSYAIKQGTLVLSTNYALTYASGNLAIGAKSITVTADAKTKTYGAADPVLTYQITTDGALVTGDTFTGALIRDAGENVGSYNIKQGTLALSSNYTLTYAGANLAIVTKAITVTADAKTKTYGAADPALTYQITTGGALITGDTFTGLLTRDAGEIVGSYAIKQGTLALSSNYALTYASANLTIGTKAITVTTDAKTKVYGAADPALTYQVTTGALITGDTFTGALTRDAGEQFGNYNIKQGSLALSSNYTLTYTGSTLSITKKVLTVTADNKTKVYGSANPALTVTYSGFAGTDNAGSLTTSATATTIATKASLVNSYAITPAGAVSNNYSFNYVAGTLTVTPAALTITADDKSKVFGTANPTLTASYSGFVNGDNSSSLTTQPALTTTVTNGSPVGNYPITVANAASGNYTISYVSGTLKVNNAVLTITADNKNKVYGSANPVLTASYSGFVNGDTEASLTTKPTLSTLATATSAVNTYAITATGAAISNYTLVYAAGSLTINKAILTVTADDKSRNYGIVNPTLTVAYSGFVNGDDATKLTAAPTATTTATATTAPGSYNITVNGGVSANYSFNYVNGKLTISPLTNANASGLTVSAGTLSPAFATGTLTYKVTVENGVDNIRLTPTFDPTATATINGSNTANGSPSFAVPIRVGDNQITLVVTAQDGITKITYTVNVYRGAPPLSISATNILTPNGDGKNDYWIIQDILLYPNNEVAVYDKAGRSIYSKHGYTNDWNGTLKGAPLNEGTYYYTVDLGPGLPKFRGYITVLRSN
jgi:gliding motility-associated-like protein